GIDRATPLVGVIGRLEEQKGHVYMLEAWPSVLAEFPDARLLLVGDGSLRGALERRAQDLGIAASVRFAGFRSDVPRVLDALDVLALPSLYEGMPLTAIEASAMAKPVVATAVDGTPEVIREGRTGRLVPPRDVVALSRALRSVLRDPAAAPRMGSAGRDLVFNRFDLTRQVDATAPDNRVRLVRQERTGKSPALNRGVAEARGEVLVFTDANALFAPDAIARLTAPFADPSVGLVSGQGLYGAGGDARAAASGYVRYEASIKTGEAALDFVASADGAIYALRHALYRDLAASEVNDLLHPIQACLAGYRCRFDADAYTIESPSTDGGQEFRRHVRIIAQGAHLLRRWLPALARARRWRA